MAEPLFLIYQSNTTICYATQEKNIIHINIQIQSNTDTVPLYERLLSHCAHKSLGTEIPYVNSTENPPLKDHPCYLPFTNICGNTNVLLSIIIEADIKP
jgi:hypothetical protein